MRRKTKLPELLAPAGSFECLLAAVEAGADAVYLGGRRFGARAFAKNFDIDELSRAVSYCHLHGRRLYVTLNTLIEDKELDEAVDYARELYKIGVDALIVCDLGVLAEIRRALPDFELHASTQMSVHSAAGAEAAYRLGCVRVVPARELSAKDIKTLVDTCQGEVEVFLHGALCVCHSGQCLFSSLVGGRSGNRGECAQPCRLPYNGGYPLSLCDLSLSEHIPELIDLGVASLKIEGRMKSADYVYTVTKIYRRLLDEGRVATDAENEELRRAFSRGGFTDGYFTGRLEGGMTGTRTERDKQNSREDGGRRFEPKRVAVKMRASFRQGEECRLSISDGIREITVTGEIPSEARSAPMTAEGLAVRLAKLGNTYLSANAEDIEITLDEGLNLPPSAINALRRAAAEAFENAAAIRRKRCADGKTDNLPDEKEAKGVMEAESAGTADGEKPADNSAENRAMPPCGAKRTSLVTATFHNAKEYSLLLKNDKKAASVLDVAFLPLGSDPELIPLAKGVYLPPVIKDCEAEAVKKELEEARKSGALYALVGNIGHISYAKEAGLIPYGDFRLNVTNQRSREAVEAMGVEGVILSPELTAPKAGGVLGAVIVYGRIPLMLTERCFVKENFGCKRCGDAAFTDRMGEKFPVIREREHRNLILNSQPTYMGDRHEELTKRRLFSHHLIFTVERAAEISAVLRAYESGSPLGVRVRRMGRRER